VVSRPTGGESGSGRSMLKKNLVGVSQSQKNGDYGPGQSRVASAQAHLDKVAGLERRRFSGKTLLKLALSGGTPLLRADNGESPTVCLDKTRVAATRKSFGPRERQRRWVESIYQGCELVNGLTRADPKPRAAFGQDLGRSNEKKRIGGSGRPPWPS